MRLWDEVCFMYGLTCWRLKQIKVHSVVPNKKTSRKSVSVHKFFLFQWHINIGEVVDVG